MTSGFTLRWLLLVWLVAGQSVWGQDTDPLPSWNDSPNREAIIQFVGQVTASSSPNFVPPEARIATFDNDGTLWAEQPFYFQGMYAIDRVRALAPEHPEWADEEPFASVLKGDLKTAMAGGESALLKMVMATHANLTAAEFDQAASQWLAQAKHPQTKRPILQMVYQPMLELMDYLRAHDFKVFIVSGGGIDFLRVFSQSRYGIPPEQVVGTSLKSKYELREGRPTIVKLPEIDLIDDKAGKPVGIHRYIGRRPILAVGNSDGDFQMLEWTTSGPGVRMGILIHHDDAEREWAYDRESHIGKLDRGLDEAEQRRWKVISMKRDWKTVFPPGEK